MSGKQGVTPNCPQTTSPCNNNKEVALEIKEAEPTIQAQCIGSGVMRKKQGRGSECFGQTGRPVRCGSAAEAQRGRGSNGSHQQV